MIVKKFDSHASYEFECSKRHFMVYSKKVGISLYTESDTETMLAYGYDGFVDFDNEIATNENLTAEEKKEIAVYMIEQWKQFGGL